MNSFFERLAKSILSKILKKEIDKVLKNPPKKDPDVPSTPPAREVRKSHPWRLCPIGEHWVRTHPLTVPESSLGGERETTRHGHCRQTPSGKEMCTAAELIEIADLCFPSLQDDPEAMPIPDSLGSSNGNVYDLSIAGWTKFWNEILKEENPLSPDFVKAFISTESDFNNVKDQHSKSGDARGLIQITEQTREILQNPKGELKDYLISMTTDESRIPEVNIAAGVRWLYHKRKLLMNRIKRDVTWEEVGAEYKGIFPDLGKNEKSDEIMQKIKSRHKRLKDQRRPGPL